MRASEPAIAPLLLSLSMLAHVAVADAQEPEVRSVGTVVGQITRDVNGTPLAGVSVDVKGTGLRTVSGTHGRYTLNRVPAGLRTLVFRWVGYRPTEIATEVPADDTIGVDVALEAAPVLLSDVVVLGPSRAPDRMLEAPAAVSVVDPKVLASTSITGQAPLAFQSVPGLDVVQSGVNDFNVNARGFNSSLNRRMLVLQDGRELATVFTGLQEWNALAVPLEDMGRVEVVRGPGSALYGANAFNGVINFTTPPARDQRGTKAAIGGGELETIRADLRHAGLVGSGRFGYRANFGYYRSDTWSRSRTLLNGRSLQDEYANTTDEPVGTAREVRPLQGQSLDSLTGEALGDRDPVQNIYGSARLDYYHRNSSILSVEGGAAQVRNEVFVTGAGRVQGLEGVRPFARVAWAADRFNISAYWNSRTTTEPIYSLASGRALQDRFDLFHVEARANRGFLGERGRVVSGASYRNTQVNSSGTLMDPANDGRTDDTYSAYTQVEYSVLPQLRVIGALRFDDGDLFDAQWSPKGAVVFSPTKSHSFHFSVNRAFQTPVYAEFFARVAAGAPADFSALEAGLRASSLGPALAGVPQGQLFGGGGGSSTRVPVLALGNAGLDVEKITGWEFGYKGVLSQRAYLTADLFLNRMSDFITDLLPGINPTYSPWAAPPEVPAQYQELLARTVRNQLAAAGRTTAAAGLTRVDAQTAVVLSYGNAGKVEDWGIEVGAGYEITPEIRLDAAFSAFDFRVDSQAIGDQLLPNTPSKKAQFAIQYTGDWGLDLSASLRLVDGYPWAAGIFQGYVPASEVVNLSAGYRITSYLRGHATVINLFDQEHFEFFGGSVLGRRVVAGATAMF